MVTPYHVWFPGSFFKTKSKASVTPIQIHQFSIEVIRVEWNRVDKSIPFVSA